MDCRINGSVCIPEKRTNKISILTFNIETGNSLSNEVTLNQVRYDNN